MSFTDKDMDFWIKENYNVLFRGRAGVGKTAMVLEAFKRNNLKWLYFSASTLDIWTDFVGIPKEFKNQHGESYLGLVRPEVFQNDDVEAIFLDEYNRGPKKLRNSVLELIQFKSINGKKFKNLRVIWTAINPEEDDDQNYDVECLDPAQIDRFHMIVDVPYKPSADYFRDKYGKEVADSALTWWKDLDKKVQLSVSPRRLDYVVDIYTKHGNIRHALPPEAPVDKLLQELKTGPIVRQLDNIYTTRNSIEAKTFLADENNFAACKKYLCEKNGYISYFLQFMPKEKIIATINTNTHAQTCAFNSYQTSPLFKEILKEIAAAGTGKLAHKAQQTIDYYEPKQKSAVTSDTIAAPNIKLDGSDCKYHYNDLRTAQSFRQTFFYAKDAGRMTQDRLRTYNNLVSVLPKNLDKQSAEKAFELLTELATRTQTSVVASQMPKLIPMLNYVVDYMAKDVATTYKASGKYFNRNYLRDKYKIYGLTPRL